MEFKNWYESNKISVPQHKIILPCLIHQIKWDEVYSRVDIKIKKNGSRFGRRAAMWAQNFHVRVLFRLRNGPVLLERRRWIRRARPQSFRSSSIYVLTYYNIFIIYDKAVLNNGEQIRFRPWIIVLLVLVWTYAFLLRL